MEGETPANFGPPSWPSAPAPSVPVLGSLSADGLHYWDGAKWISAVSPSGHHYWSGTQWLPRQYQQNQAVLIEQRSGGAAKGCLIASGIGFLVLGGILIVTVIGFLFGVVCIVIGVVMIVVGASS